MIKPKPRYDVVIIGAGPAGSLAASLLTQQGIDVLVVEKQHFPRFSIGESMLPQSMVYLKQANLLQAIENRAPAAGFQYKNGAAFFADNQYSEFDFSDKFSEGPSSTFQVKRAEFDQALAQEAEKQGAQFCFGYEVTNVELSSSQPKTQSKAQATVQLKDEQGSHYSIDCSFILDASGFARVLPRLLDLNRPSDFPVRSSIFCHIKDNISANDLAKNLTNNPYDRDKILIETHPKHKDVWYWLIPFADGTASLGVVAKNEYFDSLEEGDASDLLKQAIEQTSRFKALLQNAENATKPMRITGYSSNVSQLYGHNFALLGNAGEFLDPIFSSGVTIAFKSASLAAQTLTKQLQGQQVCWESEFAQPLQKGVETFKAFVTSWYNGDFQDIIHYQQAPANIRQMVCSILAGYVWDETNPFVQEPHRRLKVLASLCES